MWFFDCFCSDLAQENDFENENGPLLRPYSPRTYQYLNSNLSVVVKIKFIITEFRHMFRSDIKTNSINYERKVSINQAFHDMAKFYYQWLKSNLLVESQTLNQFISSEFSQCKLHVVFKSIGHDHSIQRVCHERYVSNQLDINEVANEYDIPEDTHLIFEPNFQKYFS